MKRNGGVFCAHKIFFYIPNTLASVVQLRPPCQEGGLRSPFYFFLGKQPTLRCILFKIIQNITTSNFWTFCSNASTIVWLFRILPLKEVILSMDTSAPPPHWFDLFLKTGWSVQGSDCAGSTDFQICSARTKCIKLLAKKIVAKKT